MSDQIQQAWLAQVAADGGVSGCGALVASVLALHADYDEAELSSRDVIRLLGEDGDEIETDDIAKGLYNLRDRGHLDVARGDRRWSVRLVRRLLV